MIAGGAARAIGMALARWERAPGAWRSEGAQALQLLARLSRPSGGTRAHHAALVERGVVEGVVAAHARSLLASAAAAQSADAAARNCVLVLGNLAREDDAGRRTALIGWGAARALAAAADRPPVHCRPARIESSSALERAQSLSLSALDPASSCAGRSRPRALIRARRGGWGRQKASGAAGERAEEEQAAHQRALAVRGLANLCAVRPRPVAPAPPRPVAPAPPRRGSGSPCALTAGAARAGRSRGHRGAARCGRRRGARACGQEGGGGTAGGAARAAASLRRGGARRCAASWTTVPGLSHPPRRSPASGAKRPQPRGCLARWLVRPANRGGCGCGGQELWRRWGGASRSYWTAMGAGGAPPRGWAAMGTGRERGEHKGKGRKGCCFCRSAPYPWSHYPGRQNATTPAISSCEATHLPGYSPALRGGRRGSGARCTDGAEASRGGGRFWRR